MPNEKNYIEINQNLWDKRTEIHFDSDFYDNKSFIEGRNTLNSIELALLGDVKGKNILHLQCHFGQDSISLARLGAQVTSVDFSSEALARARELNEKTGQSVQFYESDVLKLIGKLDQKFDIVFTSYGTIGWLHDLDLWAKTVAHHLKPGGKFVFAEFHPVLWMFDDNVEYVRFPYLNAEPIVEVEEGTYTNQEASIAEESISWNYGISEVFLALKKQGLQIDHLEEFDYSPYDIFSNTDEFEPGKYRVKHMGNKLPLVYSLSASKPS